MRTDLVRGHLDALLLSALTAGPTHGYGVIQRMRLVSDGALDLAEGTVYPALHRLERDGLIRSSESLVDGRRRRVYVLTPGGDGILRSRRQEWQEFSSLMTRMMGVPA